MGKNILISVNTCLVAVSPHKNENSVPHVIPNLYAFLSSAEYQTALDVMYFDKLQDK